MGCAICEDVKTVTSHVIPRAFAHEIRAGGRDLTILARGATRPQFSQGGLFDRNLLCAGHEAVTGELDRYGVDFVRRVRAGRASARTGFIVDNPEPEKLLRFAASVVWRSVVSPHGNAERWALGSMEAKVEECVFRSAPLSAALFTGSVAIHHEGNELFTVMMPTCSRQAGAWLWTFALNGCLFTLFLGRPALPPSMDAARADLLKKPVVARLADLDALDWEGLETMLRSIKRIPTRH